MKSYEKYVEVIFKYFSLIVFVINNVSKRSCNACVKVQVRPEWINNYFIVVKYKYIICIFTCLYCTKSWI